MADYDKLLQVPRGTKARLETIKLNLLPNTLVFATDTKELGVKLSNGNIEYFKNATDINALVNSLETSKHDIVIIPDTTFTITQEHFNKTLIITSSSTVTITIPTQTVESIEKGFFCDIVRYGIGEVVFSNDGVVLNSAGPLSIDAQYLAVSLIKIDNNNEWLLIGGRE